MYMDVVTDRTLAVLSELASEYPDIIGACKTASITLDAEPSSCFADPAQRLLPVHTPQHAMLSHLYAEKQASVPYDVRERIAHAMQLHGLRPPEPVTVKQAAQHQHTLLPQLAVKTAQEVPAASEAIVGSRLLTYSEKHAGCTRAVELAAAYGMPVDALNPTVYKYAGVALCDAGVLLDELEARAQRAAGRHKDIYEKLASAVATNVPPSGVLSDRSLLLKIARDLEGLDADAHLTYDYGKRISDPYLAVFNMDKISADGVAFAGRTIPIEKFVAIDDAALDEFIGEGASQSKGDLTAFKSMLETLPPDVQQVMYANLKRYLQ